MGGSKACARDGVCRARFEVRDYFAQSFRHAFGRSPARHPSDARIVDLILGLAHGDVDSVCRKIDRLMADPEAQAHGVSLAALFNRWGKIGATRRAGAA